MFTKCIELNSELFYARGFKWVTTLLGTRRDTVPPAGGARFSCAAHAGPAPSSPPAAGLELCVERGGDEEKRVFAL